MTPGRCGRAEFIEALRMVNVEFEEFRGAVHERVTDGDRIAEHRTFRIRNRGAGAIVRGDAWIVFRIRDGLIAEMASYADNIRASAAEWPDYAKPR